MGGRALLATRKCRVCMWGTGEGVHDIVPSQLPGRRSAGCNAGTSARPRFVWHSMGLTVLPLPLTVSQHGAHLPYSSSVGSQA